MATNSQGQTQSQTNTRTQDAQQTRNAGQTQAPPPAVASPPVRDAVDIVPQRQEAKRTGFQAGKATITAGKAGELCLAYKWINVPFPDYDSARFDVTSSASNSIEAEIQQDVYRKKYSGTGKIATGPVPRAPLGTNGKLIARDTVTGETIEVPWVWHDTGYRMSLWQMLKRLIWKGDG